MHMFTLVDDRPSLLHGKHAEDTTIGRRHANIYLETTTRKRDANIYKF